MKLYYKPGACSLASHIILNELGIEHDIEKVDTKAGRTETGDDYRAISPNGYVPALKTDDGEIITENPAVLQYIADQHPDAGLAPAYGSLERTRLQEVLNFITSELHKAFGPFFHGELDDAARQEAESNVGRRIDHIDRLLSDGHEYLVGNRFSVADAYAFVVLNWTTFTGINLAKWPRVKAYVERIGSRPATQRAMQAEGLREYRKAS